MKKLQSISRFQKFLTVVLASLMATPPNLLADALRIQLVPGTNQSAVLIQNTSATNDYRVLRKLDLAAPDWSLERQVPGQDGQTTTLIPTNYRPNAFFTAQEIPSATNGPLVLRLTSPSTNYFLGSPPTFLDRGAIVSNSVPNFERGQLTVSFATNGDSGDILLIQHQGTGAGQIGVTNGFVTWGGVPFGIVTGGTNLSSLQVLFTATANATNITAMVRQLTFQNNSLRYSRLPRTLRFDLTDGRGLRAAPALKTINVDCPPGIDAMVVIDVSQSLSATGFALMKQTATNFIGYLNPNVDRVGVVTIHGGSDITNRLTNNFALVRSTIVNLGIKSGTVIHPAISNAQSVITSMPRPNTLKMMLLLSDGQIGTDTTNNQNLAIAAANLAKAAGTRIIGAGFVNAQGRVFNDFMRQLASSPADYYGPASNATPSEIVTQLSAQLRAAARSICRLPNSAPSALPQLVTVMEDTPTPITLAGTDPDGDSLGFRVLSLPQHGTISGAPPAVVYSPHTDYYGPDNFTFVASDGLVDSAPATVNINVLSTNDPPVAFAQSLTNASRAPFPITLTGFDPDGDNLTFSILTPPTNGTLNVSSGLLTGQTNHVTYTPSAAGGRDHFTFVVDDRQTMSAPAPISIQVLSPSCPFLEPGEWQTFASAPQTGLQSGSVTLSDCFMDLIEGDSFLVSAERTLIIPGVPLAHPMGEGLGVGAAGEGGQMILSITYSVPTFDSTATNRMRDAFEVALVDAAGRPLTFTIQGSAGVPPADGSVPPALPPSPDALFNHSDGKTPFAAPGAAFQSEIPNPPSRTLVVDVSQLPPSSTARLLLRLVNNDRDRATTARITDVRFKPLDATQNLNGSVLTALAVAQGRSSSQVAMGMVTVADCGSGSPRSRAESPSGPKVVYGTRASKSVEFRGTGVLATNITVPSNFLVEVFAEIPFPGSLAIPHSGSGFGINLFVSSGEFQNPSGPQFGDDKIFRISPAGEIAMLATLAPEADPIALEFANPASAFGDNLFVSSNNRDGGRPGDQGGTIQRVDVSGAVVDFTAIGLPNGPGQPAGMVFGRGESYGTELYAANSSAPLSDIIKIQASGNITAFVNDGLVTPLGMCPWSVDFGRGGAFGGGLYFVDICSDCRCVRAVEPDGAFGPPLVILPELPLAMRFARGDAFGGDLYVTVVSNAVVGGDVRGARGGSIYRVKPDGTMTLFASGFTGFAGEGYALADCLEFTADGSSLFVADHAADRIYRISPKDTESGSVGPTLAIASPTDKAHLPPGRALLTGYALASQPAIARPAFVTNGLDVYFGEDVSYFSTEVNDVPRLNPTNSLVATAAFRSRLVSVGTEGFESFPSGSSPIELTFGTTTASFEGYRLVNEVADPTATLNGAFPSSGTRFLLLFPGAQPTSASVFSKLTFSAPQAAFGFFGTDFEANRFELVMTGTNGSSRSIEVPVTLPQASGGAAYFGFVARNEPFVSVEFRNIGAVPDGFGFDDLTIGRPEQVLPARFGNQITLVTVNGTPVDALDSAGNFFSAIEVRPGQNVFEVVATDAFDLSTTNTITVYGTTCPQNFASLGEVSASVMPEYGRTSFNEWTRVLYADLALRNAGTYPIRAPFYVGISHISDPSVKLLAPDGVSADGIPYYDYSAALTDLFLLPSQLSLSRALAFHNPNKVQFTYDLVVLGQLNQAPAFTTAPVLEAIVGKPYFYDFNATDLDGDALTYSLVSSPTGMVMNAQLSTLSFQASTNQLGTHDIRIRTGDGKDGIAEQHYLLNVINPPSNRPPYFVSTPITVVRTSASAFRTAPSNFTNGQIFTASSTYAREVRVYDAESLRFIRSFSHPLFSGVYNPRGMAFNERGNLVCAADSHFVEFSGYGIEYGRYPKRTIEGTENLVFDRIGNLYTTTATFGTDQLNQYRASDYVFLQAISLPPGAGSLTGITFDGRGRLYVGSQADRKIHVLQASSDFTSFTHLRSFDAPNSVEGIQFNQNGELIAAGGAGGDLVRYNPETGVVLGTFDAPFDFWPVPLTVDNQGRIFTSDFENGSGTVQADIIRFSPDGATFVATNDPNLFGPFGMAVSGAVLPGAPSLQSYVYDADARDPDLDPLTYSLVAAPTNMTINPVTGLIRWTPTADQIGNHDVTVQVHDGRGGTNHQSYRICVLPTDGNRPPMIVSRPGVSFLAGQNYATDVDALDPDGDTVAYLLESGPEGMTIDAGTGLISWLPTESFLTNSTVTFSDGDFAPRNWGLANLFYGREGRSTATVQSSGGNPGAFRYIEMAHNGADRGDSTWEVGFQKRIGAVYRPSQQGAIFSVGFSIDTTRLLDSGVAAVGLAIGPALLQNEKVYVGLKALRSGITTNWVHKNLSNLRSTDFALVDPSFRGMNPPNSPPDFSTNAAPIEFGFFVASFSGFGPFPAMPTEGVGFDNWQVTVTPTVAAAVGVRATDSRGGQDRQSFGVLRSPGATLRGVLFEDRNTNTLWDRSGEMLVANSSRIQRYDSRSGLLVDDFIPELSGDLLLAFDWAVGPDTNIYVCSHVTDQVKRYDGINGSFLGNFAFGGGLKAPSGLAFGPDGTLYVSSEATSQVLRYDGQSGHFLGVFHTGPDAIAVRALAFGPDGNLYVDYHNGARIVRLDGTSGAVLGTFAAGGGLSGPEIFEFGPDGNLYVCSANTHQVMRFSGADGHFIDYFVSARAGGLDLPFALTFGPDNNLYVASSLNGRILRYRGDTGAFIGDFIQPQPGDFHRTLRFLKDRQGVQPELGLGGWNVYLDLNDNRRRDIGEPFTATGTNGGYSFRDLPDGNYVVRQERMAGWQQTGPSNGKHQVTVSEGVTVHNLDFGNLQGENQIPNRTPSFTTTPPGSIAALSNQLYRCGVIDPDGDSLSFDLVTHPEGMLVETNSGVVAWRPLLNQLGTHDVILRVQDGRGGVALQSWQITVTGPNSAPVITSYLPGPAVVGLPYRYVVRAQDADGGALSFSLGSNAPTGMALTPALSHPMGEGGAQSAVLSWTPALANIGSNTVEIIVRDEGGEEARQVFILEVAPPGAPNRPPQFVSAPRTQTRLGLGYAYEVKTTDMDGDLLNLSLVSGPAGMVLTNGSPVGPPSPQPSPPGEGVLTWTPTELGNFPVALAVNDGRPGGVVTQRFVLTVTSTFNNLAPLIVSTPPLHATDDQPYVYDLAAEDADGDAVTWRLVSGPVGMSLDPTSGALRWIPTIDQLGTNTVTIEVQDSLLASATQTWPIDVSCVNRPPAITSIPPTSANVGDPYLYAVRAADPDGDALTFSFVNTNEIPSGMTLSNLTTAANGSPSPGGEGRGEGGSGLGGALIRWTPTTNQVGAHLIRLRVRDGRGGENEQTYTLYAIDQRANKPPVIVSTPPRGATVDRAFSYSVVANDPDGDVLTFQLLQAPSGAILTPAPGAAGEASAGDGTPIGRGEGVLSWTPTVAQLGSNDFILVARDPSSATASQRFTVLVRTNQAPVITSIPRTNAVPGVGYRYDVSAIDPDGDALTYAFASSVPSGMSIDTVGRIAWTSSLAQTGSFPVSVSVSDPFGATTNQSFTVLVAPDTQPPTVALTVIQGLVDDLGQPAVDLNQQARFRVTAADNVGVADVQLNIGGTAIPLSADLGSFSSPVIGLFAVVATARDAAGNVGFATNLLRVVDRTATNDVFVQIHSPTNGATLTAPTAIVATITNVNALAFYRVEYARADQVDLANIAANSAAFSPFTPNVAIPGGTKVLSNAVLATFDPTMLLNDAYLIRVYAEDVNKVGWYEPVLIGVSGNLKFGEFRLEFTDLAVPLAGIPITIQRVYDTRESRRQGDFGHGWSLGLQDAQIRETLRNGTMFNGSRVYLTTPDGRRVGFTAYPVVLGPGFGYLVVEVRFRADPGVQERLEIIGDSSTALFQGGSEFRSEFGDDFNPDQYRLIARDGTLYEYNQTTGLQQVTDRNSNRLQFNRAGVFHYQAGSTTPDQGIPFQRDAQGRITQILDPNGKALTYTYDGAGDLRAFADQVTNTTRYFYSASRAHFLTNIVDPLGRSALRLEYDASGRLKTVLDANGNPISQDFDAGTKSSTFTDGNGTVIRTRYDDNGNEVLRRIDGVYTNTFAYDANNNLLASTNGRGFSTNYTYDARGNVTSIRDSLGNRTTIAYNEQSKPVGVTNALGQILTLSYSTSGQLTQVVNNAGFKTVVSRDAQGRVASLTDATGTNTTVFDYSNGCACGRPGKVINPDGSFRLYEYTSQGLTNRVVNELGAETLFHHDDAGRLLWMRDPLTNYTYFHYNGPLLTNVVDALGRSTRYEYDALNRTNRIIDAEGGVVEFRYDRNGNRTHVIDAVTNVTTFVYDAANRLTNQIDTFGHTNHFAYDAAGNRTEAIDRNGRKRTFAYDAANRMTNELWWEGTNVVRSIVFGFNELGVQTLAADPAARYVYSYDALNRLERVLAQSAGVPDFTLLYTHTGLGQVESVTDNWGVRVGSAYDNRSRLAQRTWQGPGVDPARVQFAYDVSGNRIRTDRFSDLAGANRIGFTTNAYNHAGIVTNITHRGPASQVLAKYDYVFDAAYQIRNWTINNQPSTFDYDRTGQLTNAVNTAQPNENFRYDANGNRVGVQSGGSYVVGRNNQVLSDGTNNYAYDFEGNMTSRSNTVSGVLTTYQWDHRNRLLSVLDRNPSGVVTQTVAFVYDAMNRRLSKTVNGVVQCFLYNGDDSWADLDGSNAVTARYLHGARIDELLARQRTIDGRGWYLTDHLGTVRDIANAAGAVVAHVDYSSFGQVLGVSNSAAVDRFEFTGRELDEETGLYFYRARYCSAQIGRFIGQDPIGFSSKDHNLYRYVGNAPSLSVDPIGTTTLIGYVGLGAAAGALGNLASQLLSKAIYGKRFSGEALVGSTICGGVMGLVFFPSTIIASTILLDAAFEAFSNFDVGKVPIGQGIDELIRRNLPLFGENPHVRNCVKTFVFAILWNLLGGS